MQLETCHLGKVQGMQRTIHTGHGGSRPRLSEADKERLELRRRFVRAIFSGQYVGLGPAFDAVIWKRYVEGKTQAIVAEELLMSQPRICQLEKEALETLRDIFEESL